VLVIPPPAGVAPEPPTPELLPPALFALPAAPAGGFAPLLSDEPQATDKHTAQAPNSDNSSLFMIGSRSKAARFRGIDPQVFARRSRSATTNDFSAR